MAFSSDNNAMNQSSQATQADQQARQQQQNQQQQQQNQNADGNDGDDQSNQQDNLDISDDFWDNIHNDAAGDDQNQQQQNVDPADLEDRNAKFMDRHIKGMRLTEGIDYAGIKEGLDNGDFNKLNDAFMQVGSKVYQNALLSMNKVVDQRVDKAVETAVAQSRVRGAADLATEQMHDELKYTLKGSIKPMAEAVFAKALERAKSKKEAIKMTDKYFQNLGGEIDKVSGSKNSHRPGRSGFNGKSSSSYSEEVELSSEEWDDVFGL